MEYRDHTSDFVLTPEEQDRLELPEIVPVAEMLAHHKNLNAATKAAQGQVDEALEQYSEDGILGDFNGYAAARARAEILTGLLREVDCALFDADEAVMQMLAVQFPQFPDGGPEDLTQ